MPNISIKETEETSIATFDATENTVLVPILYTRKYDIKDGTWTVDTSYDLSTAEFSDYTLFKKYINSIGSTKEGYTTNGPRVLYTGSEASYQIDRSYVMVHECLVHGLKVVVKPIALSEANSKQYYSESKSLTILKEEDYHKLLEEAISGGCLQEFKSRNIYNIKFITSGGYPNIGKCSEKIVNKTVVDDDVENFDENTQIKLSDAKKLDGYSKVKTGETVSITETTQCTMGDLLVEVAVARQGDAIALLELPNIYSTNEGVLTALTEVTGGDDKKYAAAFYPWINVSTSAVSSNNTFKMPACYGYLMAYANSVRSNANWFAAAGTQRGYIPTMKSPVVDVSEALMHALQCDDTDDTYKTYKPNIAVNPIMNTGNYGVRLWGNRVANAIDNDNTYSQYLNVRILVCDLRKQLFHSSLRSTFEPNDDIAWFNFKSMTNTLLEQMKSGRGIQWYRWKKETSTQLATIKCTLTIKPIEAVESFDITITLTDKDESAEEA